jgi:hypothetical protein
MPCAPYRRCALQAHVFADHHIAVGRLKGAKAKPYQVKQIRTVILKYKLLGEENDSL